MTVVFALTGFPITGQTLSKAFAGYLERPSSSSVVREIVSETSSAYATGATREDETSYPSRFSRKSRESRTNNKMRFTIHASQVLRTPLANFVNSLLDISEATPIIQEKISTGIAGMF